MPSPYVVKKERRMTISLAIPTTLHSPHVHQAIERVLTSAAPLPQAEVLIVVNGVTPTSYELRVDAPAVRVLRAERAGAASARNVALQAATYDTLLFTDDDCLVPETWCTDLARDLLNQQAAVVAAPVQVAVCGPVTAYLNHRRAFDAPPLDAHRVIYPVTANCGVRRDLLPESMQFDAQNFPSAGSEDTEFGYRLRDAGLTINWLADCAPVEHVVSEDIREISDRYMRYGRGHASMYYRCGRRDQSIPFAHETYRSLCVKTWNRYRRYPELSDDRIRARFATYDIVQNASFLVGYLEALGNFLGHPLISPDHAALACGWQRISRELDDAIGHLPARIWQHLPIECSRLAKQTTFLDSSVRAGSIADHLQRHAPLSGQSLPSAVHTWLTRHEWDSTEYEEAQLRLKGLWQAILDGGGHITFDELNACIRAVGLSVHDGCHSIETSAWMTWEER